MSCASISLKQKAISDCGGDTMETDTDTMETDTVYVLFAELLSAVLRREKQQEKTAIGRILASAGNLWENSIRAAGP
jgi:hypothetical protein